MSDVETLAERVRTVERAVTDGDHDLAAVEDVAALTERVAALEREVDELNERTDELTAATQALRGYVGNVRSVNDRVEGRADAALAATERLEERLDAMEDGSRPAGAERTGAYPRDNGASGFASGGNREETPAVDTHDNGETERDANDDGATGSGSPGVLGQIRSLL